MNAPVFVDTNVLLYARDAGEPLKRPVAAAWLEHLWREHLGRTSVQVLSEYYVNVTRKLDPGLDPDDAWEDVQTLLAWRPLATDAGLLEAGRRIERRHRLHWWDSLIVAAAQAQGCAILLTEDLQDGATFDELTVRSPFTLRIAESAAIYGVDTQVAARHPPRGRPRKQPIAA